MSAHDQSRGGAHFMSGSPGRFAATLVVALVATAPGFREVLRDGASLPPALARFLMAFVLLWALGSVAAAVLRRQATETTGLELPEMVPGAAGSDR